jgi:hypothetical protein
MKLPLTGSCQCRLIRYEITEAPELVYTCHCTDCQRITIHQRADASIDHRRSQYS